MIRWTLSKPLTGAAQCDASAEDLSPPRSFRILPSIFKRVQTVLRKAVRGRMPHIAGTIRQSIPAFPFQLLFRAGFAQERAGAGRCCADPEGYFLTPMRRSFARTSALMTSLNGAAIPAARAATGIAPLMASISD